jgi:hypothetical protein
MFEKTSATTTFVNRSRKDFGNLYLIRGVVAVGRVKVSHFQPGGITLVAETKSDPTRGCSQDQCSPKEKSMLPRRPKLQEYFSKPTNSVLCRDLLRRNSYSQANREGAGDKSALLLPSTKSKTVSKSLSSMKLKRVRIKGIGNPCPVCGRSMERREHTLPHPTHSKKPYGFSEWDWCPDCKYLQHYEEFKIKS